MSKALHLSRLFSSLEVTIKLKKLCVHPYIVVNLISQYDVDMFAIQSKQTYSYINYFFLNPHTLKKKKNLNPHTLITRYNDDLTIMKSQVSQTFFNIGNQYLPTYQILMISDNVEFLPPIFCAVFWQPF